MSSDNGQTSPQQRPAIGTTVERVVRPHAWVHESGHLMLAESTSADDAQLVHRGWTPLYLAPTSDDEGIEAAKVLLQRCLDGFGAYIHGRKLARTQRDRLREDLQHFLEGRRVRTLQPERDVSTADVRDWG